MNVWIKTSDRLPPDDYWVIVLFHRQMTIGYVTTDMFDGSHTWYLETCQCSTNFTKTDLVPDYWIPLPSEIQDPIWTETSKKIPGKYVRVLACENKKKCSSLFGRVTPYVGIYRLEDIRPRKEKLSDNDPNPSNWCYVMSNGYSRPSLHAPTHWMPIPDLPIDMQEIDYQPIPQDAKTIVYDDYAGDNLPF